MMDNNSNFKHTDLTGLIIKEAYHVYNTLGHGFVESVYEKALAIRLRKSGLANIKKQFPIQVFFEGENVGDFKADLIVNDIVIVELKAVKEIHEKHDVQLVNYLKATTIEVGLVINFGEKIQIKRKVFSNDQKSSMNYLKGEW